MKHSDTLVGTASAAQTVTLNNIGTAPLTITSIVPTGDFTQTNKLSGHAARGPKLHRQRGICSGSNGRSHWIGSFQFRHGRPENGAPQWHRSACHDLSHYD